MFKRTRTRLIVINVLVVLILLNFLGAMVYLYMHYRLFQQANDLLLEQKSEFEQGQTGDLKKLMKPDKDGDHRLVYILWNQNGKMDQAFPESAISAKDIRQFSKHLAVKGIHTLDLSTGHFLYLNESADSLHWQGKRLTGMTIQLIYNLQREEDMLHDLFIVIEICALISVVLAVAAGFYLANLSLVPIKKAWEKQQRFVSDASHELRTPLSVMKLNLEHLFRHPDRTIEEESETILQAIQEINYMTKMTNELLTLARSDAKDIQISKENVELSQVIQKVTHNFIPLALQKNITLDSSIEGALPVKGESERLKQLMVILLDNAIKYTKEGGHIDVKARRQHGRIYIEVKDTGVGISAEELPHIFDRYYRGDRSRTRQNQGTGLGLSIARWIVEAHGGKIHAISEVGQGTRFEIALPSQ